MKFLWLIAALFSASAHAYTGQQLLEDCRAADEFLSAGKSADAAESEKSTRCLSYLAGFADSYAVSEYLAEKIGVRLNAFCLKKDPDLSMRLVRAVLIHVERTPPGTSVSTATLVAGAFSKAFPCSNSLETKR